jgi:hypothetical protein
MVQSACSIVGPMLGAFLMRATTLQYAMLVDVVEAFLAVQTLFSSGMLIAAMIISITGGISNWMTYAGVLMLVVGVLCYILTRKYDGILSDKND